MLENDKDTGLGENISTSRKSRASMCDGPLPPIHQVLGNFAQVVDHPPPAAGQDSVSAIQNWDRSLSLPDPAVVYIDLTIASTSDVRASKKRPEASRSSRHIMRSGDLAGQLFVVEAKEEKPQYV
jgi:hypothetical protein